MHKKIALIIVLLVSQLINAQEKTNNKVPVFNKSKMVGFLYKDTKLKDCKECYVLDSLKIFDKIITIKSEALIVGFGENEKMFTNLYTIEKTKKKEGFIIVLNNTMNSTSNTIYIKKIREELFILKQFSYSSSSTKIKIGKNDYADYLSNYICFKKINKKVANDTLNINDLIKYKQNNECFHCPPRYSMKECLRMKNRKEKFEWN